MLQFAVFTPAAPASTIIGDKFKLAFTQLSNNMPFAYKLLSHLLFPYSTAGNGKRGAEKYSCSITDFDWSCEVLERITTSSMLPLLFSLAGSPLKIAKHYCLKTLFKPHLNFEQFYYFT